MGLKNPYRPEQNFRSGSRYLRFILNKFDGNLLLALAGYNAGPEAVVRAGYQIPNYSETKSYFPKKSTKLVGQPIRTNHLSMKKSEARRLLRFESSRRIIFFIGGSQGAQSINQAAKEAMGLLLKKYAVIASVGSGNIEYFKDINVNNALVVPFLNEKDLAAAYTLADIVVSRAGGSIFEIAAWGRPSILIPIPDGHQVANARAYEERGGAIVLEERELFGEGTPDVVKASQILAFAIESVLTNEEISSRLRRGAKEFAHIDAASRIATILLETVMAEKNEQI